MHILLALETLFDRFSKMIGFVASILLLLMIANVFYDVIMRYLFNDVSIGMQEMEWHLFSAIFLLGISYTLNENAHVRVDIIYDQLSPGKQAFINISGTLVFLIPFSVLITWYGFFFAKEAWLLKEMSGDPGGLPHRWMIKSVMSIAFVLVIISSFGFMLRSLNEALGISHKDKNLFANKRPDRTGHES